MINFTSSDPLILSIGAVERETGLSKDTLRVWERRYGFPQPGRDAYGERAYPEDQIEKLRIIKRLMDGGHRPGRIVPLDMATLRQLSAAEAPAVSTEPSAQDVLLASFIDLIKAHRNEDLRRAMSQTLVRMGLGRFVEEVVAPLNQAIGQAWMSGTIEVFEEHAYTESVLVVLRNAINSLPAPSTQGKPQILLTTFPEELHGLGLLMAEALFALEGCACVSLGTQTPLHSIVAAAKAHATDIVALSFSPILPQQIITQGLQELRAQLPAQTALWVGGSSPALHKRLPQGIKLLRQLRDIPEAVLDWRDLYTDAL